VGVKGSRKAVLEVWAYAEEAEALIHYSFACNPVLTLAQVFDSNYEFIKQYERL
jgi:hypothetical protein